MATVEHRRLRAAWVATLLLLMGLLASGIDGRPAGLQAAERAVSALPAVTTVAGPADPVGTTIPRQDARALVPGSWSPGSWSPGHPTTFVLAAAAVALALPRFGRWWRTTRRGSRPDSPAEHQTARGPPPPARPVPR
jgi:hypothetical protein